MDPTAAARRRRRRRVAEENRKRAARAEKSPLNEDSPTLQSQATARGASASHARDSPRDNISTESHELLSPESALSQGLVKHVVVDNSKRVQWPNILSRLREAFSLDPQAAPEERDMVAMQARMIKPKALHPYELTRLRAAIDAFPPQPVADFLLSVFTKHATDTFFYFDQAQLIGEIEEFYATPTTSLRSDPSFIGLAMATFALASQWTTLERPEGSDIIRNRESSDLGRLFHYHAKTLMPDILDRSCLRSIQAPFVLGVYLMPASAIGSSYVYMGMALRKALTFDLHLNVEDQGMDEREKEVRRRLWWSIYSLERCTTVKLNRPRSISADIITALPPSPYPPLDRLQTYDNIHFQIAYSRLIKILDQVADLGDGQMNAEQLLRCSKWEADLKEWKRSLPQNFKLDRIDPKAPSYRTVFHLYLNYYYSWITMGKVSLVTVARSRLRQYLLPEHHAPQICDTVRRLSDSCTKAARKLLQLFENLTNTQNITRFSFTDFQGCSIATIVTLVAGILERDSGYEARVAFGLDCLGRMAAGNMTAQMGVRFVEAVRSITNEAAEKLHCASSRRKRHDEDVDSRSTSAYNQWAEWLTIQEQEDTSCRTLTEPGQLQTSSTSHPVVGPWPPWQAIDDEIFQNTSSIPQQGIREARDHQWLEATDQDLFSGLHGDEQTLLMGLTGLDALDFSGLTDQL
ncbi:uncharacterized protein N7496_007065 [Penicillium cataractarum]|uniref:Xylanolytic transcriptional activator regulatory domain-containing protein n=1 Tax=Penicillium cataractarum TaxID=2100454 RepID=A0A9W9V6R4_9EURO|nr:uncharacterized protein N7496_007065 [Penicillium cataractarum]KAJ5370973.1 hypothetical protein N7496_007065 [Penicillium cataractarum]